MTAVDWHPCWSWYGRTKAFAKFAQSSAPPPPPDRKNRTPKIVFNGRLTGIAKRRSRGEGLPQAEEREAREEEGPSSRAVVQRLLDNVLKLLQTLR